MERINLPEIGDVPDKHTYLASYIHGNNLDIEFLYVSDFRSAKILRDFVEVICHHFMIDNITLSRFILIVDEMNNNAIEHGSKKGDINKLRFKIFEEDDIQNIQIEVEDSGRGKDHKTALEMETLRAHQLKLGYRHHKSIRGRGLFMIIVHIVDRLYFRDTKEGGLVVGIKKKICSDEDNGI